MALTKEQRALVSNLNVWEEANAKYHELELAHREELAKVRPLAQRVIDLGEITLADKAEIESIRAAYNALEPFAQEYFQNYYGHNYLTDLKGAETKLAALEKAAADQAAAQIVIDKINAIGEVTYTPECKAKIDDAQKAYMALTKEQRALVSNISVWEQANAKYHELELAHREELAKVRPLVQRVIDLGEITWSDKAAVESIRADYEALQPFAQEYFQNYYGHNYLADLEAAEAKLIAVVAVVKESDMGYATLDEAISAAQAGQTVVLVKNVENAGNVVLMQGITLDLNGNKLSANNVLAIKGNYVVDNQNAKGILNVKGQFVLDENNGSVPVRTEDGYHFYQSNVKINADMVSQNADSFLFKFRPSLGSAELNRAILANGAADNGLQIRIKLTWVNGDTAMEQNVVFAENLVQEAYMNDMALTLGVGGLANGEQFHNVQVTAQLVSVDSNVVVSSSTFAYTGNVPQL